MLNVGVVGVGSISQFHIDAYLNNPEVNLVAFCDINESRLKEKARKLGVSKTFTNYQDLLNDATIDAISICTWNNTHAEIAKQALLKGKHVLVEKPLSMDVATAEELVDVQKQSGKVLQVGFVRRHAEKSKVVKSFVDNGGFGDFYYAKASYLRRLGNPGGWFSDINKSGGGPLIDLGVHMVDLCWYLMGKPKPISVTGNTYKRLGNRSHIKNLSFYQASDYDPNVNDVEDLANALIRFENGASMFLETSFTLHASKDETKVTLFGDKGGVEVEPDLTFVTEENNTILNTVPQIDQDINDFGRNFQNQINHFVDCCLHGKENIAPVQDGVAVMKILKAIYQSAEENREIYL
ncbi:oxidoreductase [Halolactibacillus alkaliphilus]|uniref:Oxidoreductase n=1 Tax=Halolactibacillus alkaliphilus TaxID=442899 RepID=A0A511WZQ0_9BACI|nr:Gfo/Idh/MocA family oxidoreductase [Halolactibacillus alkaliphilus]GEN56159.1 oxidoreductase [Halolactibacillus alkaliphilus]GGN66823.1 oxidoreductase [Halolactibacillus alkaliphilus]SFO72048.1 Predicted dehydrogenase [Halolactibacillus alkaliphilus]